MRITTGMLQLLWPMPRPGSSPPTDKGRRLKIYYDPGGHPSPHFVVFCNDKSCSTSPAPVSGKPDPQRAWLWGARPSS